MNEMIRTSIVLGNRHFGIHHQFWDTPTHGVVDQFIVQYPGPRDGSVRTGYGTLPEAKICWYENTQRRIGADGEVRCGDIMRFTSNGEPSRRLCGECCQPEAAHPDGCGCHLETWRQ